MTRGFSIVEIMISLVIFSAVILGLAGLAFQVAKRGTKATDQALVMSVLLAKVDRASTIPFDSLSVISLCDTTYSGIIQVKGCTAVTALTSKIDSIRIDVRTNLPGFRPDTIYMRRSRNPSPLPLR